MIGACLCGRVTVETPGPPAFIHICNCDFCRKSGHAIGQFAIDAVKIRGITTSYVREDMADPWLTLNFCPVCGSATHTTGTLEHPTDVVRVNMRLFAQSDLTGTEVRYLDGHSVIDENDPFPLIATARYGADGTVF